MARQDRREHPTPGIAPRMNIEAHASTANARKKNLQAFAAPHPSMAGAGNRGFAVSKSQAPAAPVAAHSLTGRPTPIPDLHHNAHSAPHGAAKNHSPAQGDRILDEAAVNNLIEGERHHSTVAPRGAADVAPDRLPSKPSDSATTPASLIEQFRRWNNGDGC